jgi:hypothetical protein
VPCPFAVFAPRAPGMNLEEKKNKKQTKQKTKNWIRLFKNHNLIPLG